MLKIYRDAPASIDENNSVLHEKINILACFANPELITFVKVVEITYQSGDTALLPCDIR